MAQQASTSRLKLPHLGRWPQIVAFLLVLGVLVAMLIQPTRQLLTQNRRLGEVTRDLARIDHLNERLRDRIDRLQDPDFIEQQARERSGLVKPGEVAYVVMPETSDGQAAAGGKKHSVKRPDAAQPAPEPGIVASFLRFIGIN